MGENCCLCFPLECGVKTLAFFVILQAIITGGWFVANPDDVKTLWPYLAVTVGMALSFLYTLIMKSEESRKFTLLAWIVLVVVIETGLYVLQIVGGDIAALQCTDEKLQERNDGIAELERETGVDLGGAITYDQCVSQTNTWLWIDWTIKLLINLYFASVLRRWSTNDDAFNKH